MNLTDWGQAQALAQRWVAEGEATSWHEPSAPVPRKDPISVDQAWESFLAQARARKLSPATIYKYDLLRRQMLAFAERRGLRLIGEFNLDVLEAFQAEWSEGALASLKKLERLKAFFRAAFVRRWVDDNPAVHLRGPKVRARPTLPFTREDMANILAAVELPGQDRQDRACECPASSSLHSPPPLLRIADRRRDQPCCRPARR